MGSLPSRNTWRLVIPTSRLSGMSEKSLHKKKLRPKKKDRLQRKGLVWPLTLFFLSLVVVFLIVRMILIKDNWKRIFLCLLPKCLHLYDLSFVEAHFFRRLILKQNTRLNFPSRQKFKHDLLCRIVKRIKE
jgi:hypothetical protein